MKDTDHATRAQLELRQMILSGQLAAGERLVEVALVERLGVSRTPIRAALARLAEEGLLHKVGAGYAVRSFTMDEARDAIRLRGVLEGMAARIAAERRAAGAALANARQCVDELEAVLASRTAAKREIEAFVSINQRFHASIVEMADSFVVARTLGHVCALPFASPNAFMMVRATSGDLWRMFFAAQQQHRSLLRAIEGGDAARAEALGREHAHLSLDAMESVLSDQRRDLRQVPGLQLVVNGAARPAAGRPA